MGPGGSGSPPAERHRGLGRGDLAIADADRLRVAFAHGGGAFPGTIGRIQHGFEVRPDLCAADNPVSPRQYLGRFYVDSLVHDPEVLILAGSGVADSDEFAWLGDAVRSGCLAPTRAGLVEIARGCRDRALVGAASLAFLGQTSALLEPG